MGVDFSVNLIYGVRVKGSDIPWDDWHYDEDGVWEEVEPYKLIGFGGYTDSRETDIVVGDYIAYRSDNQNSIVFETVPLHIYYEVRLKEIRTRLDILGIPYSIDGLFMSSDWS